MKRHVAAAWLHTGFVGTHGMGFAGEEFESNVKSIKVVGAEGCLQNTAESGRNRKPL